MAVNERASNGEASVRCGLAGQPGGSRSGLPILRHRRLFKRATDAVCYQATAGFRQHCEHPARIFEGERHLGAKVLAHIGAPRGLSRTIEETRGIISAKDNFSHAFNFHKR